MEGVKDAMLPITHVPALGDCQVCVGSQRATRGVQRLHGDVKQLFLL